MRRRAIKAKIGDYCAAVLYTIVGISIWRYLHGTPMDHLWTLTNAEVFRIMVHLTLPFVCLETIVWLVARIFFRTAEGAPA